MIDNEKLYHSILHIIPNAAFSFWMDDNRQNDWEDYSVTYEIRDGWCIAWKNSNGIACPSIEEINAVTQQEIDADISANKLAYYVDKYSTDLSVVANYETAKSSNPDLTFEDYVAYLLSLMPV